MELRTSGPPHYGIPIAEILPLVLPVVRPVLLSLLVEVLPKHPTLPALKARFLSLLLAPDPANGASIVVVT